MRLPTELIDLARISEINLSGRGGKESEILKILPGWKLVNEEFHDFQIEHDGKIYRLEAKKQQNQ